MASDPHQCDVQGETVRYSEMTKMGFMGQMGLKKRGGKKRKSRKAKKSRKRGKRGGMDDMCINYKHKLDGHSDYVNLAVVTQKPLMNIVKSYAQQCIMVNVYCKE